MFQFDVLNKIADSGIVAVVRAQSKEEAIQIAQACIKGGLKAIEVTFTVPHAEEVIQSLYDHFSKNELLIGAGTILDSKTAKKAILAGAKYIVSPGFDLETLETCHNYQVPYLPGCMTVTEMMTALSHGVEIIKLFPGSLFGPGYVKALKGPLPNIHIMPTGGVSLDNINDWVKAGVIAVGVGSELTKPAKQGDYEGVTRLARAYVDAFREAKI